MKISVAAEKIFNIGPIPITNSMLTSFIAILILAVAAIITGKNFKRLPTGVQNVLEMVYEMFENLAVEIIGEKGKTYVPLIVTFFLYIISSNWISLIPGVGSIGLNTIENGQKVFVPLFRGGNADLNTTLALALISVVATQFYGISASGIKNHLKHFINPLEIVSEVSKIFSFGFRLFGNIFAGEVLLLVGATILVIMTRQSSALMGIPGGILQAPFYLFEVFVGFIQAFIFAVLSLVFISIYVQHKVD